MQCDIKMDYTVYNNILKPLHISPLIVLFLPFYFRGEVNEQAWRFLLTGGVALENPHPNPFPHWLSEKSWGEVVRASDLPKMKGWFKGMHIT